MKIGQVAPLMESVPPRLYGGTERIVSYLTEELVRMGHEVTLFASGDSITSAQLVGCVPTAIRLDANIHDPIPYYMLMLDRVRDAAEDFDILHFHIDQFHFPLFKSMANRTVTTLHGRQDLPDLKPLYLGFPEMPLISISDAQREPVPKANFVATVHHGIPSDLYAPNFDPRGGYVAFLGRISPEKRPDRAIRIAQTLGIPLKIAAKIDRADEAYFREQIEPMLQRPGVEFIGEINERAKASFLSDGPCPPVSGRLAGTVRHRDDRGHGLRHSGAGLSLRLGTGDRRQRSDGPNRRHGGGSDKAASPGPLARPPRRAPAVRATLLRHSHGEGLHSGLSFAHETAFAAPGCRSEPQRGAPDHESRSELIVASCSRRRAVMPS